MENTFHGNSITQERSDLHGGQKGYNSLFARIRCEGSESINKCRIALRRPDFDIQANPTNGSSGQNQQHATSSPEFACRSQTHPSKTASPNGLLVEDPPRNKFQTVSAKSRA